MAFVELDQVTLVVLMTAGGLFALAGLWLMFRPQPAGEAARIELFGIKVQASSAGLLVFLIGAAFLAVPLFVPREAAAPLVPTSIVDEPPVARPAEPELAVHDGRPAVILPAVADAREKEPNNFLTEANQIERGVFYAGGINPTRNDPEDWFVVSTAGLEENELRFQIRSRAAEMNQPEACAVDILNEKEILVEKHRLASTGSSIRGGADATGSAQMYLRLYSHLQRWCSYELKVF